MNTDVPFRIVVALLLLSAGVTGAYHRSRARTAEKISHRDEGYLFATVLRLFGLGMWIGTFAYLIYPPAVAWAALPLPVGLRWVAVVPAASGALMFHWTMKSLGKNITDTVVTRSNAELVTHGPYRYVRHPLYVSAALLILSVAVVAASGIVAVCGIAAMVMLVIRTPHEERRLIEKFGDSYREYMRTTGGYWPRLK